jgi:Family of unknown function (DUF6084)
MPDLNFRVDGVEVPPFAATPQLAFQLGITNADRQDPIHSITLRCQVRIAATRRRYNPQEQERLIDLFGEPDRWSQTLHSLLWTHASVIVPAFDSSSVVDLNVACTYDFNVAATKYFYALDAGEVPLLFLFSGTIFYAAGDGALQIDQIAWSKEAPFRLPILVWQEMMDRYYPNNAWLPLRKDVFDRLYRYKRRHGLPTWEHVLEHLLPAIDEEPRGSKNNKHPA